MANILMLATLVSFTIALILGPIIIPVLASLKFGQSIREIGPNWHKSKSGTPTMGGLIFIISIIITTLLINRNKEAFLILFTALGFGIVGFIDDYIKVILRRNLGLSAAQKFIAQLVIATAGVVISFNLGILDGKIILSFFNLNIWIDQWIYMPFAVIVILSTVNSVNLTDGLDGLATGITLIVSVFFTFTALAFANNSISLFMSSVTGACLAFLVFNSHPAKVFMGDTGSLFLGGLIAAAALVLKIPFMLILVGGIFVIESLSVILQVIFFKTTGKRIFKMSPIHHHFEMVGWKETKIVSVFTIITVILCLIGFIGINRITL